MLGANEVVAEAEFLWGLVRKDGPRAARLGALAGAAGVVWTAAGRGTTAELAGAGAAMMVGVLGWAYIGRALRRNERVLRALREEIRAVTSNVPGKMRARVDPSGARR